MIIILYLICTSLNKLNIIKGLIVLEIQKMTLSDLNIIKEILYSDFDDFWNYDTLKEELSYENSFYIIAVESNEICGFAGFKQIIDNADIMNIVVKKIKRNKKIGTFLLENLIKIAKEKNIKTLNLEVNVNNIYAIKLYQNLGFKNIGIRKNYYRNSDNAIIMQLTV